MNKGAFLTWKWHAFCVLTENSRKFQEFQELPASPIKFQLRTENSRNFQHFRVLTGAGDVSSNRTEIDMCPLVSECKTENTQSERVSECVKE